MLSLSVHFLRSNRATSLVLEYSSCLSSKIPVEGVGHLSCFCSDSSSDLQTALVFSWKEDLVCVVGEVVSVLSVAGAYQGSMDYMETFHC